MYYHFNQNNSGGSFVINDTGLSDNVIIEAENANEANKIAENIGIYFNGCYKGFDCDCCGDRWYPTCDREGKQEPMIYDKPAKEYTSYWSKHCFIHYKNGVVEKILYKEENK